jgi:hypothetical protein
VMPGLDAAGLAPLQQLLEQLSHTRRQSAG